MLFGLSFCIFVVNTTFFEDYLIVRFIRKNLLKEQILKNIEFVKKFRKNQKEIEKRERDSPVENDIEFTKDYLISFRSQILSAFTVRYLDGDNIRRFKIDYATFELKMDLIKSTLLDSLTLLLLLSAYFVLFFIYLSFIRIVYTFSVIDREFPEIKEHSQYLEDSELSSFNWLNSFYNLIQQEALEILLNSALKPALEKLPSRFQEIKTCSPFKLSEIKEISNRDERIHRIYEVKKKILRDFSLYYIIFPIIF